MWDLEKKVQIISSTSINIETSPIYLPVAMPRFWLNHVLQDVPSLCVSLCVCVFFVCLMD